MNEYTLELENDVLLNPIPFIKFCKENEHTDIKVNVIQESHCLTYTGVYDILDMFKFNSVTIWTCNALESHNEYNILNSWTLWLDSVALNADSYNDNYYWNRNKVFGGIYGRPSAARLGIASYLHCKYPDRSLIKARFNYDTEDTRKRFELEKLFSWDPASLYRFELLYNNRHLYRADVMAYDVSTGKYYHNTELNTWYKDIFVDIIVEPTLFGNTFYPTEKLARAIVCKKPFIVLGSQHYLQYLKQLGFQTFKGFWSEQYDSLSVKDRYFEILKVIDYLGTLSTEQLIDMYNRIQPTVEHNYNHLLSQSYPRLVVSL